MNLVISTGVNNAAMIIPLNLVLWGVVMAYVIHILEESILPEVFVDKVKRLYFPQYSWDNFFWFNTMLLSLNIAAVIVYESLGGWWIIFPLALACERTFNGVYHLIETIRTKKFSSGLLASTITWILIYLIVRYSLLKGEITLQQFGLSAGIGLAICLLMIVPLMSGAFRNFDGLQQSAEGGQQ
jgi:hypothetical protein